MEDDQGEIMQVKSFDAQVEEVSWMSLISGPIFHIRKPGHFVKLKGIMLFMLRSKSRLV